jgi:hypothetical protein
MDFFEKCDGQLYENKNDGLDEYRKLSNSILSYIVDRFDVDGESVVVDAWEDVKNIDIDGLDTPPSEYDDDVEDGVRTFLESVGFAISFNPDWANDELKKFDKSFNKIKGSFFPDWAESDKPGFIAYAKSLKWPKDFKDMGNVDEFIDNVFHGDI